MVGALDRVSIRARSLLFGCALLNVALPASAELRFFYCYVPDNASGTVYVSDLHPVGPIDERAAYGAQFLAYLKTRGLAPSATLGYCTMRATQAEAERGRRQVTDGCRECGEAKRITPVQWERRKRSEESKDLQPRHEPSAPERTESAPNLARAEICSTDLHLGAARRQECLDRKPVAIKPSTPAPASEPSGTTKRPRKPPPAPTPNPQLSDSLPEPEVNYRKTQACTTLPRELDTVIVVMKPEIFVTMTPGTFLYMRDHLNNELKLGYGKHRVRPGTYKLGIYGVTDPFNPLKQTLQACVAYHTDF